MNFTKNIGMLLLAIWLILGGLIVLVPAIAFNGIANLNGHSGNRGRRVHPDRALA